MDGTATENSSTRKNCNVKATTTVFNNDEIDENTMTSQDDLQFLDIMKRGAHKTKDGSYEMPLPFKKRPILTNKKAYAERGLTSLNKRLDTDKMLCKECHIFMNVLIKMRHAEVAPSCMYKRSVVYPPIFCETPEQNVWWESFLTAVYHMVVIL